jgi:NAD(P)H-dependent FMN reductase
VAAILGLSGSLRRGSFNAMLLRAAAEMAPAGTTIEIGSIEGIPLYNQDVEDQGIPATVQALKERVIATDGLLLVSPEYNNSIPGVMKNAIDWLSRPPTDVPKVFRNRPVGVIGVTPGAGGTMLAQIAWLAVLRTLGTAPWFGARVQAAKARDLFDANGRLTDETVLGQLQTFVTGFAKYVDERKR